MGSVQMIIRMVPAHLSLDEAPAPTKTEGVSSLSPPPQAVFFCSILSVGVSHILGKALSPIVSMLLAASGVGASMQTLSKASVEALTHITTKLFP